MSSLFCHSSGLWRKELASLLLSLLFSWGVYVHVHTCMSIKDMVCPGTDQVSKTEKLKIAGLSRLEQVDDGSSDRQLFGFLAYKMSIK